MMGKTKRSVDGFAFEETEAMGKLNLIVKVRDTTEGEVRKALKAAGIEVKSIVAIYKEENENSAAKDDKDNAEVTPSSGVG